MNNRSTVSLVIPVYSGEQFLESLVTAQAKLKQTWEADANCPFMVAEAIFVLDSPQDDSESVIRNIAKKNDWIRVLTLSRNFGQHPATIAGVLHTSGDWIVTMDEDLQHDPAFIPTLIAELLEESSDIIYAKPITAVHENLIRDLGSRFFKRAMSKVMQNPHIPEFNSFRLMRGGIARAAASVCSHETYFDIALCWFTDRIKSIKLPLKDYRFIRMGTSGYSFGKLLSHARRMAVSSRARSFRLVTIFAAATVLTSFVSGLYVTLQRILYPETVAVQGWASLFVSSLFFGGIGILLLSILMEYVVSMMLQIQGKPTFFMIDRSGDEELRAYFNKIK